MTKIIQLTGYATKEEFTFSSLKLGDNEEKVRKFFGPPTSIDDVEEIKGYAYSYEPAAEPFKITIEFINKKVYTFRFRIKSKE
jgi:hypothetical protein